QQLAKVEMIAPEVAVHGREMQVIGPRVSPAKEVPSGDPLFAPIAVTRALQPADDRIAVRAPLVAAEEVEHRLGDEARDGGAADVLEPDGERCKRRGEAERLAVKELTPDRIVFDQSHHSGLEP